VISCLCTIAFYYLLRSVEYSNTGQTNTRTQRFTLGDVTIWHNNTAYNATVAPPAALSQATAATLRIHN